VGLLLPFCLFLLLFFEQENEPPIQLLGLSLTQESVLALSAPFVASICGQIANHPEWLAWMLCPHQ
jgi:hypothetical protein